MRQPSPWKPRLADGPGSPSERLARAIAEDVADGSLPPGSRMPPHRVLAHALGLSTGTVTKAFAMAERRGLVAGEHGRGTFVRSAEGEEPTRLDLAQNLPPPVLTDTALAGWLGRHRVEVGADRLVLTNGAQHALSVAATLLCRPGDVILTEAATYHGVKAIAGHFGLRLRGVALDAEGLVPDDLDAALRELSGTRVVHSVPTRQNPTARTMGRERRREIAAILRRHDAWMIEDDVYSVLGDPGEPTLAELLPERTLYANGLSKALSPGLRIGCLAVPKDLVPAAERAVQATAWTASPQGCLLAAEWLADGTVADLAAAMRAEVARRTALAVAAFPGLVPADQPPTNHVWLPMPHAEAERFARHALAAGILVTPPDAPIVDPALVSGVRICLGPAPTASALARALETLRATLVAGGVVAVV